VIVVNGCFFSIESNPAQAGMSNWRTLQVNFNISTPFTLLPALLMTLILASCQSGQGMAERFAGNTLVGKDYATWFPDSETAVMDWQGNVSTKRWWVNDNNQFCHTTEDGEVCEEVKQIDKNTYEFCGRWGCFPAELKKGNFRGLNQN
jgi:hypothetical protein